MIRRSSLFEIAPLAPSPPENLYFSDAERAWVLSRHRDVLLALRSPCLIQAGSQRESYSNGKDLARQTKHSEIASAVLISQISGWQAQIKALALASFERLRTNRTVDLVTEFIRPWCLYSALALTGIEFRHGEYLANLIDRLCKSDAAPRDVDLKSQAKEVNNELDFFFRARSTPSFKSLLLGVAQTLPTFIAGAWVALLQSPCQRQILQAHPEQFPKATEELLRYAGPVHTLFRQADRDVHISGTTIHSGDRLLLRLSSANRDPQRFAEPDRLDCTRKFVGHLALSAGVHYCPGAAIVRTATTIATRAFLSSLVAELSDPVVWSRGTMLIWPSSVPVFPGKAISEFPLHG